MSAPELFRVEAVQAQRGSWLGTVSLLQPLRLWLLAALSVALAATILSFLAFGQYTRRATVGGELVPDLGLSTVLAPADGVLARSFPQEGERVAAGSALALVQIPRATAAGADLHAAAGVGFERRLDGLQRLDAAQEEQIQAQRDGLLRQIQALRQEQAQTSAELATRAEQVRIGRDTVGRYRAVVEQRYASELQLKQQEQALLELIGQQQAMQRQASQSQRVLAQLRQSLMELPAQRAQQRAEHQRLLAQLQQERLQQDASGELMIKAPVPGLVASRLVEPGQAVKAGQPLMSLLPSGSELQAQLWVPSSAIGFVAPGDRVLLRYRAFPYQKFGQHHGRVLRVSRSAVAAGADAAQGENAYRVVVALERQSILAYGRAEALRPGMRLDADILGERRRLYEWLLEPLYSVRGRIGA